MKFNHKIKNQGFSKITFAVGNTIFENDFLSLAINELFKFLYASTISSRKFFLIVRLQFENGSFKTLGKGVIVDNTQLSQYILYISNLISMRGNEYKESVIDNLIFDYFLIDKDREKYYTKNWVTLKEENTKYALFELDKVNHYLPSNRDYLSWGNVRLNTPELKIVYGNKSEVFEIYSDRV